MSLETWEIDRLASSANFSLVMSWVSQRSRILSPGLFKRSWRSGCSMEKLLSDPLSQHRENPKVFQGTARKKHSLQAMVFLLACVIIIDFYLVYHYPTLGDEDYFRRNWNSSSKFRAVSSWAFLVDMPSGVRCFAREKAILRIVAKFLGELSFQMWHLSSWKTTSSPQWSVFSIPQWLRILWAIFWASRGKLEI